MELLQKLVNELDTEMVRIWDEYTALHAELDTHRGKPITDTNLDEVNRLLKEIQEKFGVLYHAFNFIATRHQFVGNAVTSFNDFIETLKKSGAKTDEEKSTIIT